MPIRAGHATRWTLVGAVCLLLAAGGCGSNSDAGSATDHTGKGAGRAATSGGFQPASETAVPVQTTSVVRRSISRHLETNGVLEAENEVEVVARVSGPIAEIAVEEGSSVREGQLLARIDDREYANQVAIARVARDDARRAFERTQASWNEGLVSQETHDSSLARVESAEAQLEAKQILLDYTRVTAPFAGQVSARHIKLAQTIAVGTPLFRLTDFTPLLCPIQVPEKDLPRLGVGQPAYLRVEAYPDQDFAARVQRIRPTVEAATGTITVTLEVDGRGLLRPGMFASVYLQTDTHSDALVIPLRALVLDSIGDTVFIRKEDRAVRREVKLGFRQEDLVEVLEGLAEGEEVVVLGQDGLADGTPVTVLEEPGRVVLAQVTPGQVGAGELSPEMTEQIKQRMRERGLSDQEIEERLQRMREGGGRGPAASAGGVQKPEGAGPGQPGVAGAEGGMPPQLIEFIRNADPQQLEMIKQRMRERGRTEQEIADIVKQIRGTE